MVLNSPRDRLRRLARDDAQAVAERQAGLDAAHDDVDGVGKVMQEVVLAPLLQKAEQPARDAEAAGKGCSRLRPARRRRPGRSATNSTTPIADADHDELPLRPAQAGLRDAHRQAAGSSAFFCRTSSSFSVSSTCSRRTFGLLRPAAATRAAAGSGRDDAFLAPLGLPLARQDRIDEHPDHARRRRARPARRWQAICIAMAASALVRFAGDFGGVERGAEPLLVAEIARAFPESRPADAGRAMAADQLAVLRPRPASRRRRRPA